MRSQPASRSRTGARAFLSPPDIRCPYDSPTPPHHTRTHRQSSARCRQGVAAVSLARCCYVAGWPGAGCRVACRHTPISPVSNNNNTSSGCISSQHPAADFHAQAEIDVEPMLAANKRTRLQSSGRWLGGRRGIGERVGVCVCAGGRGEEEGWGQKATLSAACLLLSAWRRREDKGITSLGPHVHLKLGYVTGELTLSHRKASVSHRTRRELFSLPPGSCKLFIMSVIKIVLMSRYVCPPLHWP